MASAVKRDRDQFQADYTDKENSPRDIKKHIKSLPIRAPTLRLYPPASSNSNKAFSPIASQVLTPVESSDEELLEREACRLNASRARQRDASQESSGSSTSSTRAQAGWDDDMDMGQSPPTEPEMPSFPTIDLDDHFANTTFLQTPSFHPPQQHRNGTNRIPTPIRPTFRTGPDIEMFDTNTPGNRHPTMPRTALSPTMREDTPPADTGLPSPTSEHAERMEMSLSPDSHLSQTQRPDTAKAPFYTSPARPRRAHTLPGGVQQRSAQHGFDGQTDSASATAAGASGVPPPTTRTPRLHMGYRADCDKCIARVPGHYSHILWT